MNKTLCIYHGNCADGFGAAWVVRRALGDSEVDFHPGVYGETPPDVTGRDVVMVDFSFKRPVIEAMVKVARSILILDHHKTAANDLAGFPPPITPTSFFNHLQDVRGAVNDGTDPRLPRVLFDMERSGAGLTWDYFIGGPRPKLIDHIEDRDLWRFNLPGTREIQAAVFSYPYDFDIWDKLMDGDPQELAREGAVIERKHFKDIAELLKVGQRRMTIAGYDVPVCNLPYTLSSDAGHAMGKGERFAACYMDTPAGRVFSLRSAPDGIDVSDIAKQFGGGGHKNAAGFTVPHGADVSKAGLSADAAPSQNPSF